MKTYLKIYTKALEKVIYTIAFILTVQFCFAQTIDFSNISPEEEEELLELYKNNHLSPEKLTKEQRKLWDAKIEKENTEQELNVKEQYLQQSKTEFIMEDNKPINQYENKSSSEIKTNYQQEENILKALTIEELNKLEAIEKQDQKIMKLVEEEKPINQ